MTIVLVVVIVVIVIVNEVVFLKASLAEGFAREVAYGLRCPEPSLWCPMVFEAGMFT